MINLQCVSFERSSFLAVPTYSTFITKKDETGDLDFSIATSGSGQWLFG